MEIIESMLFIVAGEGVGPPVPRAHHVALLPVYGAVHGARALPGKCSLFYTLFL